MIEKTGNIMWMAEQLDFNNLSDEVNDVLNDKMNQFLRSAANKALSHSVYPAHR